MELSDAGDHHIKNLTFRTTEHESGAYAISVYQHPQGTNPLFSIEADPEGVPLLTGVDRHGKLFAIHL